MTNNNIEIFWDGNHRVEIKISELLQSKVCGLCGDFNGKKEDDWRIGQACPNDLDVGQIVSIV